MLLKWLKPTSWHEALQASGATSSPTHTQFEKRGLHEVEEDLNWSLVLVFCVCRGMRCTLSVSCSTIKASVRTGGIKENHFQNAFHKRSPVIYTAAKIWHSVFITNNSLVKNCTANDRRFESVNEEIPDVSASQGQLSFNIGVPFICSSVLWCKDGYLRSPLDLVTMSSCILPEKSSDTEVMWLYMFC